MKKVIGIILICLALSIPGIAIASNGSILTAGASSIPAGSWLSFSLNLENIDEAVTAGSYSLKLTFEPTDNITIENAEGKGTLNPVDQSYEIESSDLDGITKLHFTITADSSITTTQSYTVTLDAIGTADTDKDQFSFTVVPKDSPTTEPTTEPTSSTNPSTIQPTQTKPNGQKKAAAAATTSNAKTTYKGSSDNYLSKLSVSGYQLTSKFNKTNDTYFVTVPYDVTGLSVTATPCDSDATVVVAGNSNLSSSTERSKIVISVTAENGDVRTYRIYVDRGNETED